MKLYKLIEFKSSNEINTIGIYTSELAIWLYLSYIGCQNDKRFKIIPIEINQKENDNYEM